MNKHLFVLSIAGIVTFVLFAFMAFLIKDDKVVKIDETVPFVVEVFELPEDTKAKTIIRHSVQPPEPPPVMEVTKSTPEVTEVTPDYSYTPTDMKVSNTISDFNLGGALSNQDARPIVRANPKYPTSAAQKGIEGWVKLGFDINEIGEVINIQVIESEPKRVFDKAAKNALRKWKYKAKSIEGKAIVQTGFSVQLDFKMEQEI